MELICSKVNNLAPSLNLSLNDATKHISEVYQFFDNLNKIYTFW